VRALASQSRTGLSECPADYRLHQTTPHDVHVHRSHRCGTSSLPPTEESLCLVGLMPVSQAVACSDVMTGHNPPSTGGTSRDLPGLIAVSQLLQLITN
jgi:hypothetical protein